MSEEAPTRQEGLSEGDYVDHKSLLEKSKLLELRAIKAEDERDLISTLLVSRCNDIEAKHLTLITELREKLEDLEAEKYFLMQQFQERVDSMEKNRVEVVEKLRQQLVEVEADRDETLSKFREKCKELETMTKLYSQEAMDEKIKEIERSKEKSLHEYRKHLKSVETDRDYLINDLTKRFDKANQDMSYLIELIEKLLALHQIRLAETEHQRDVLISKLKKRLAENQSLNDRMDSLKALLATHGDARFLELNKGASEAEFVKSLQGGDFPTVQTLTIAAQLKHNQNKAKEPLVLRRQKSKGKNRAGSTLQAYDANEMQQELTYKSPPEAKVLEEGVNCDMFTFMDHNHLYLLAYNG